MMFSKPGEEMFHGADSWFMWQVDLEGQSWSAVIMFWSEVHDYREFSDLHGRW